MVLEKQINWVKKNKKILIVGGICLIVGSAIGASDSMEWKYKSEDYKLKYETLETRSKELTDKSKLLEDKLKELEGKVKEAEPWFSMDTEKRKATVEANTADLLAQKEEAAKKEREAKEANAKAEEEEAKQLESEIAAAKEAKSKTLSNGKYEAGNDFEPGKYDIVAVKGGGNVMCPGSINAIMGVKDNDMYQREYKNITFKKGQILDIRNVTIKLIPVNSGL